MAVEQFKIVEPFSIPWQTGGGSYFGFTDLNEPDFGVNADPAFWNGATAYTATQQVLYNHKIYQRLISGTTATAPDSDFTNWAYVRPANKWAMFDTSNTTQTQQANGFSFHIFFDATQVEDTLVFDNVDADNIRVTCFDSTFVNVLSDVTIELRNRSTLNWWDYFFQAFVYRKSAVFTLPPIAGMVLAISVTKNGSTAKVGTCVLGRSKSIGLAQWGTGVGIVDYSTKSVDTFGNTTVVPRAFTKRMNVPIEIDTTRVDEIVDTLAKYRATPAMYVGSGNNYSSLVALGFYKNFDVTIQYFDKSLCNLEIESLV